MTILDTSILIPLLDGSHPHHSEARERVARSPVWQVPAGVISELCLVVRRSANRQALDGNSMARRMLTALEAMPAFRCLTAYDSRLASRIYLEHPSLSYVDAWGIAVALDRQEPLLTLDETQQRVFERLR